MSARRTDYRIRIGGENERTTAETPVRIRHGWSSELKNAVSPGAPVSPGGLPDGDGRALSCARTARTVLPTVK